MALGAHEFTALPEGGLSFQALILPFKGNGERSTRAAKHLVVIRLTPEDLYSVRVLRLRGRQATTHFTASEVYCDGLPKLLLSLDWDGPTATNPRYWP